MFCGIIKHGDRWMLHLPVATPCFTLDVSLEVSQSSLLLWKWQPLCHPIAYYPRLLSLICQLLYLCHRKQKKMTGQFKGLVRATKRGAANVKQKKGKRWRNCHANAISRQLFDRGGLGEWVNHWVWDNWGISNLFSLQLRNYPRNLPKLPIYLWF